MQWRGRRGSSNIGSGGRGRTGMAIGGGGIILGLLVFLLTGNPLMGLNVGLGTGGVGQQTQQEEIQLSKEEKTLYEYSSVVLADTEDAWNAILKQYNVRYREPKMKVFQNQVSTGCGVASSGVGPFYCGQDEALYMDLSFYRTLLKEFNAKEGDFVMSYVISHEVGHHVQKVLGILDKVNQMRQRVSKEEANALTVRLELQADYLAGVVARYQKDKGYLDPGDIDEAISTAWAIGDDTIQKRMQGSVQPESFTHGSSKQRTRWFKKGYEAGNLSEYNTFDTNKYPTSSDL